MRPGADVLRLRALEAYHDGELRGLARLRLERHLARSPELRLELEALRALRARLRERDEGGPAPDLWPGIEARLAAATLPAERPRSLPRRLVAPIGALAAAAAAAAFALVYLGPEPAPQGGVVRWLDSRGTSVLVLEDDSATGVTVIWLLDPLGDAG
jgi:ferric-dicitrate binding protein FerR (iron transport regulator)